MSQVSQALDLIKLNAQGIDVELYAHVHRVGDCIIVDSIKVNNKANRNQGRGTDIMKQIIDLADANNMRVALSPSPFDGETTSVGRLKKFYSRFGFKPKSARGHHDARIYESMIRLPR